MKKQRRYSGFSLVEMIAVVGIIAVLSAVAFIGVSRYQRSMNQLERDAVAKEIFIAAQNHLTMARNEGYLGLMEIGKEDPSVFGTLGTANEETQDKEGNTVENKTIYYYVVNGAEADSGNAMFNMMLPYGAIDETVRGNGSYIIRYQPSTGLVLDVFYCSKAGTQYGHNLTGGEEYETLMNECRDSKESNNKSRRREYGSDKAVVGWYGGEKAAATARGNELEMPKVTIENGARLLVKVDDPNSTVSGEEIELIIVGKTSGAKRIIKLKNPGDDASRVSGPINKVDEDKNPVLNEAGVQVVEYTVVLDDITTAGLHFAELASDVANTPFLPGEDIDVQAISFNNTALSNIASSEPQTTNSLFEKVKYIDADDDDAVNKDIDYTEASISSMRHLLNLNPAVSGVIADASDGFKQIWNPVTATNEDKLLKVTHATQTTDLDWNAYLKEIKNGSTDPVSIYKMDGTNGGGDLFIPIDTVYHKTSVSSDPDVTYALTYDGDGHSISNLKVNTAGNAGLFGTVGKEGADNVSTISDLVLINSDIKSTGANGNAGALAANLVNTNVTNVLAYNSPSFDKDSSGKPKVTVMANGSAGGLIGAITGGSYENGKLISGLVSNSAAALVVNGATNAGGLIGMAGEALTGLVDDSNAPVAAKGAVEVSYSYAGGHTVNVYKKDSEGHLIQESGKNVITGTAYSRDDVNVSGALKVKTDGSTETNAAGAMNAGGLIGFACHDTTVTGSYSTASASAYNAGGLIGAVGNKAESTVAVVKVDNSYATGLVVGKDKATDDKAKAGAFLGGEKPLDSSTNNYYAGGINGEMPSDALDKTVAGYTATAKAFGSTTELAPDSVDDGTVKLEPLPEPLPGIGQTDKRGEASPYSTQLLMTYKGKYTYLNINQMPGYTLTGTDADEDKKEHLHLYRHYGDWASEVLDTSLEVENGDKLTAKVTVPTAQVWEDCEIPMLIKGEASEQETYLIFTLNEEKYTENGVEKVRYAVSMRDTSGLYDKDDVDKKKVNKFFETLYKEPDTQAEKDAEKAAIAAIYGTGYTEDQRKEYLRNQWLRNAGVPEKIEPNTTDNTVTIALDLDNIASQNGHFAQLFPDFIPGENLIIAADGGYKTLAEMEATAKKMEDAVKKMDDPLYPVDVTPNTNNKITQMDSNGVADKRTMACRTNSLFADPVVKGADGSNLTNGTDLDNPTDPTKDNAGIASIRHLENLDASISSLGKNDTSSKVKITDATQIAEISWSTFADNVKVEKEVPDTTPGAAEGATVKVEVTNIYKADGTKGPDNSYIPVTPSRYGATDATPLTYSGQSAQTDDDGHIVKNDSGKTTPVDHSITGISIDLTAKDANDNPLFGGDAGLFGKLTGGSVSNLKLEDMQVKTQAITEGTNVKPGNAGALAGTTNGTDITNVVVYNIVTTKTENGTTTTTTLDHNITTSGGNAGGLVGDMTGGKIEGSAAAVYVSAEKGTVDGCGNAGGLVGAVSEDSSKTGDDIKATIIDSYSGGHTSAGAYEHNASTKALVPNVQSTDANAGGLIGTTKGSVDVSYCYSTSSAGATGNDAAAGGLIGNVVPKVIQTGTGSETVTVERTTTVEYVYALGETDAPAGADGNKNAGTLIGKGTVKYDDTKTLTDDEAKHTHTINLDVDAVDDINKSSLSDKTKADAMPYDTTDHTDTNSDGKYDYDHPTIVQMHQIAGTTAPTSDVTKSHYGDWPNKNLGVDTDLTLHNEDILYAQVDMPKDQVEEGKIITMLIRGDSSTVQTYLSFVVEKDKNDPTKLVARLMDNSAIPGVTVNKDGTPIVLNDSEGNPLTGQAYTDKIEAWQTATNTRLELTKKGEKLQTGETADNADTYSLKLNLDDITSDNGHFTQLFPEYIPGENISVIARGTEKTQAELAQDLPDPTDEKWGTDNKVASDMTNWKSDVTNAKTTLAQRTNSLFADIKKSDGSTVEDTAVITSIRHLENLDSTVSHLDKNDTGSKLNITKTEQTEDLIWKDDDANTDDFIHEVQEIKGSTSPVNVVTLKPDGTKDASTNDNCYLPVTPSQYNNSFTPATSGDDPYAGYNPTPNALTYNGQETKADGTTVTHSISGIKIDQDSGNAGLFGELSDGSKVNDLKLVDMEVKTGSSDGSGNAGAVAGTATGTEFKNIEVYNTNNSTTSNIVTNNGNAGGLVGDMTGGKIEDSAAAVYVEAKKGSGQDNGNAGGLVGAVREDSTKTGDEATAKIIDSYSGGHNSSGSPVNVMTDSGNAGGLIGSASGDVDVSYCYSTSSAGSTTGTDSSVGGLIGKSEATGTGENVHKVSVDHSYALGDTSAPTGTTYTGALVGSGPVVDGGTNEELTADEKKYTHSVDVDIDAVDDITSTGKPEASATPYNTELGITYDHPTVAQLHEIASTTVPESDVTKSHHGDWPTDKLGVQTDLKLNNGDILQAQVDLKEPKDESDNFLPLEEGQIVTMLIRGESSGKDTFLSFVVGAKDATTGVYAVRLMDNSVIPGVTEGKSGTALTNALNDWASATRLGLKSDGAGTASLTLNLDDITTSNGHFAQLFPQYIPGENISVIARGTAKTQAALATDIQDSEKWNNDGKILDSTDNWKDSTRKNVLGAKTNSLFADVTKSGTGGGSDGNTAEITSIRHLENLDPDISDLGKNNDTTPEIMITNAKQTEDLNWTEFVDNTNGESNTTIHITKWDGTPFDNSDNSYIPVTPPNAITYDAKEGDTVHTIENVKVTTTDDEGNAGLFGKLPGGSTISDLTLEGFDINAGNGDGTNAGVLAGKIGDSTTDTSITNVTVNNSTVTTSGEDSNAGAIAGTIENAEITNAQVDTPTVKTEGENSSAGGLGGTLTGVSITGDTDITTPSITTSGSGSTAGGLAGTVNGGENGSSIEDVTVTTPTVTATGNGSDAGGLAGKVDDTDVEDVTVTGGSVTSNGDAGGLIGEATGTSSDHTKITNAEVVDTSVTSTGKDSADPDDTDNMPDGNAGGLIATAKYVDVTNALVHDSTSTKMTTITAKATSGKNHNDGNAGGLIGYALGCEVEKSAAAVLENSANSNAGGLIGTANTTTVSASYAGGHTVDGAYSATNYNTTAPNGSAGGLIGEAQSMGSIANSYSTCSATGVNAGGLIGKGTGTNAVSNAYATGLVSGSTTEGAIAGTTESGTTFSNVQYYGIINERQNSDGTYSDLSPVGSGSDTGIAAFDATASSYDTFVGPQSGWEDGHPYDSTLSTTYGNKYNLKTVEQLGATVASTDHVDDHYGDWPSPETLVVNTPA